MEEIRFHSERIAQQIRTWIEQQPHRPDEWVVLPRVTYHRFRATPVKEFWVQIHSQTNVENAMEILLAKRPFRPLSNSSRLDQVELLAYAWNICLWVQEAAAQTMYHYPNVALICRVNPFTQIQVKVSLSALIDKSKTIF